MSTSRGRVLRIGGAPPGSTLASKHAASLLAWIVEGFWVLLAVLLVRANAFSSPEPVDALDSILVFVPALVFPFLINYVGVEVDAVYEMGIASKGASLWDTLTGRGFQEYGGVAAIGRIAKAADNPDGILLFAGAGERYRIWPVWNRYDDDFFAFLNQTLRERCPGVPWLDVVFDDGMARHRMHWRDARRRSQRQLVR